MDNKRYIIRQNEKKRESNYNKARRVYLHNGDVEQRKRSMHKNQRSLRTWVIAGFVAVLAVIVFAVYFFGFSSNSKAVAEASPYVSTSSTAQTTPTNSIEPDLTPVPTTAPEPSVPAATPKPTSHAASVAKLPDTMWGAKSPGKFTTGAVEKTATSYKSAHINVSVQKVKKGSVTYYLTDIYLTDLKYFKTAFAGNKYGSTSRDHVDIIGKANNAVVAINGDYYPSNSGPVLRNGVLYRDKTYRDVLVMYNDGSMETFLKGQFNMKNSQSKGAYQIWTFGPQLLQDGQPMTKFNSSVTVSNPRTAIGYYEPGHYCFVTIDGRQPGYSTGYTMKQLSQLFYDLGCKVAFNLDGGGSTAVAFMGKRINSPCADYRKVYDILYITDTP